MDTHPDPETLWQVSSLLAEYCATLDSGRFDEWIELFTPEGQMEMATRVVAGRERLLRFGTKSPRGIHICGLPLIVRADDAISSTCPWTFVEISTGGQVVGYYHDDIVWHEGRYRFRCRRIEMYALPVSA